MRADAGFHPDPTRRQIGESGLHLATRPLLPQHDGTALILANDVERVLADIDADYGGRSVEFMFDQKAAAPDFARMHIVIRLNMWRSKLIRSDICQGRI